MQPLALALLVVAAISLTRLPGGVRPGSVLAAAAAALSLETLPPVDAVTLRGTAEALLPPAAPTLLVDHIAAAFHRAFICCLGCINRRGAEPMVLAFVGGALLLAGSRQ